MKTYILFLGFVALGIGSYFLIEDNLSQIAEENSPKLTAEILPEDTLETAGPNAPDEVNVIIEIERGTKSRYKYDAEAKRLMLFETSYYPLNFPGDFGTILGTTIRGGEALGIIVLTIDSAPPGTFISVRPIAVIVSEEKSQRINTIVGVPIADIRYKNVNEIADLQKEQKDALINYLGNVHTLKGRPARLIGYEKSGTAKRIVELGIEAYEKIKQ
ncbi:MAG: inorganic diphosphatase [Candidatus Peribacteraceae bacterium]|nr:inorganic diphosphatase [Candidatus Peribacteraceae bacterium]